MAIIYTYPEKTEPVLADVVLITDSESTNPSNQTKTITLGSIKDSIDVVDSIIAGSGIDVSSATGAVTITNAGVKSLVSANTAIVASASGPGGTGAVTITSTAYTGGTNIGHVPTGSGNSATLYLDGSGKWSTPTGDLTIEDEDTQYSLNPVNTINFKGGGVSVSNGANATTVDVEVLPRLNHGFSPFPIYQGNDTITILPGNTSAIAGQAICDIAAGQLTVTRIFGKFKTGTLNGNPTSPVINVAVYTGSLTFPNNTKLVYFGSTTVSPTATDPNSDINNIFFVDVPVGASNNWVPVAGTPIVTIIEIDNSAQDPNDNTLAVHLLGTLTAASKQALFQNKLAFQVAPSGAATSIFDAAGTGNTVLGSAVTTIGNYANISVTSKRVCQHFDPEMPNL